MSKLERESVTEKENRNYSFRYKLVGELGIPSFLYDEMKKYDRVKLPYELNGVEFIEHLWIKVSDISAKASNSSREAPVSPVDIAEFAVVVKDGEYDPYGHRPPVVNEKGILIAGNLRTEAHMFARQEYMWVAVCKFTGKRTNENDNSDFEFASEHEYNKLENNQKNSSIPLRELTKEDVSASIDRGIKFGILKVDFEDVVEATKIIKSQIKTFVNLQSQYHTFVLEQVLRNNGCDTSEIELQYRTNQVQEEFELKHGKSPTVVAVVKKTDTPITNERIAIWFLKLADGEVKKVVAAIRIKGSKNLAELNKLRKKMKSIFSIQWMYDFCTKFVAAVDNGIITDESFLMKFVHQYKAEEE